MRKTEGIIQLVIGLIGMALCLTVHNKWAYLPAILMGLWAVVTIRRLPAVQLTETGRRKFQKRNVGSLILWVIAALFAFAFLRQTPYGTDGLWFMLSAYLFLTIHGVMVIAPLKEE